VTSRSSTRSRATAAQPPDHPSNIKVDDGNERAHKFERSRVGSNLQLKIGDPDKTISGPQRYRISYTVKGAFNSFDTHEEFYWNATGDEWGVPMQSASATLTAPALKEVLCYQGYSGSNATCTFSMTVTRPVHQQGALQPFQD
jgi:hypothetical protein